MVTVGVQDNRGGRADASDFLPQSLLCSFRCENTAHLWMIVNYALVTKHHQEM